MSLLRTQLESITLYPRVYRADGDGNESWTPWRQGDPSVVIQGRVSPIESRNTPTVAAGEEGSSNGYGDSFTVALHVAVPTAMPVTDVSLAGCRVDYNGNPYDLYQYPVAWRHGRRTKHWSFSMTERSA